MRESFCMSESNHLKCPCQYCGESIEFPVDGLGQTTACPHCGSETVLLVTAASETPGAPDTVADPSGSPGASFFDLGDVDEPPSALATNERIAGDEPAGSKRKLLWIGLPVLALAGTVAFFVLKNQPAQPQASTVNENGVATNLNAGKTVASAPTIAVTTPAAAKSIDDLKVGPITLEKAKGSSLVYAVGVMRNDSVHQRFGVHLELELTDARGNKAGMAKDYRAVLEPHQEWRFRALVLDSKAVSAKVAAIREEE
jgi:hypothetical protein